MDFEIVASTPDLTEAAVKLVEATRAGDLHEAYRVIQPMTAEQAQQVALAAGFSSISVKRKSIFFTHLQTQIAAAARHRTDGFGLRELNKGF